MQKVCWPYFDPDFDTLGERIYGPPCRVYIDNDSIQDCTVVKVNSENKQGLLLEVVQILTDMNLIITKSYISSDGGWFMDVFHVKDENGNKLTDQTVINHIHHAIGTSRRESDATKSQNAINNPLEAQLFDHTAIEMTGLDRPGLFSEISAAFADLHCNVLEAHAWSHNARLACIAYVSDSDDITHSPIDDPSRLASIEDHLSTVIRATTDPTSKNSTHVGHKENDHQSDGFLAGQGKGCMNSNVERRLHQLMLSVRDFDEPFRGGWKAFSSLLSRPENDVELECSKMTRVSIGNCEERGYSIVSVKSKDRRRLMFDTICTLIDMEYVIFHAALRSDGADAFQEYFIRHIDGRALNTEGEKERVIKCLEAAIERRVCEGLKLELCAENRVGLLSDITRVLRENGLTVVRADVETHGQNSLNAFYVKGISGNKIDMEFVESVKKEMSPIHLEVKNEDVTTTCGHGSLGSYGSRVPCSNAPAPQPHRFSLGDILRSQIERFSHNFVHTK